MEICRLVVHVASLISKASNFYTTQGLTQKNVL